MSVIVATLLKGWRSGEILWLIDVVGEASAVQALVQQLSQTAFSGRQVKVRRAGAGGVEVGVLRAISLQ